MHIRLRTFRHRGISKCKRLGAVIFKWFVLREAHPGAIRRSSFNMQALSNFKMFRIPQPIFLGTAVLIRLRTCTSRYQREGTTVLRCLRARASSYERLGATVLMFLRAGTSPSAKLFPCAYGHTFQGFNVLTDKQLHAQRFTHRSFLVHRARILRQHGSFDAGICRDKHLGSAILMADPGTNT